MINDEKAVDFRSFASRYIVGSPDSVADRIRDMIGTLSPTEIICRRQLPGIPTDKFEQSLRLFAEKVMPSFR